MVLWAEPENSPWGRPTGLDVWGLDVEAGIPTSGRFLKFSMNRIKAVQSSFMQLLMFHPNIKREGAVWLLECPVRVSYWFPGFSQSENNLGDSNASGQKLELIFKRFPRVTWAASLTAGPRLETRPRSVCFPPSWKLDQGNLACSQSRDSASCSCCFCQRLLCLCLSPLWPPRYSRNDCVCR